MSAKDKRDILEALRRDFEASEGRPATKVEIVKMKALTRVLARTADHLGDDISDVVEHMDTLMATSKRRREWYRMKADMQRAVKDAVASAEGKIR